MASDEPRRRTKQPKNEPPGEFLSDDLKVETARFLDEVKKQIRRRAEPGDAPKLGPPTRKTP